MTSPFIGSAQNANKNIIENLVNDYNLSLTNLNKSKDKKEVLKYISKDFSFTNVYHNIDGDTKEVHGGIDDFISNLDLIIKQLEISYKVSNIYNVLIKDKVGIAVYDVEYQIFKNSETISAGYEANISTVKKFAGGWKIIYSKKAGLEKILEKGVCLSEIFEGISGYYLVKIRIPTGTHYSVELKNLKFEESKPDGTRIIMDDNIYRWTKKKEI